MRFIRPAGALVAVAFIAAGCAGTATWPPATGIADDPRTERCVEDLRRLDRAIGRANVADAQARRVDRFPYLRSNRFLASFAREPMTRAGFDDWTDRLRALGREGRGFEIANLPPVKRQALARRMGVADLAAHAAACGDHLVARDRLNPQRRQALIDAVSRPNHYRPAYRAAGLYPLTAVPVSIGYNRWKKKYLKNFTVPVAEKETAGSVMRFAAPGDASSEAAAAAAAILREAPRDALGVPRLNEAEEARLFAAHAPVWQVDVAGDADRIGAPSFAGGDRVIDFSAPVEYRHLSHTRFYGRVLVQLNYLIWFPARPKTGFFDFLGGRFDGVVWRVTLGPDGRPLIYDSIHQCGCYHLFFPTARAVLKPGAQKAFGDDEILAAQQAPAPEGGERMLIHLETITHYILGLAAVADGGGDVTPLAVRDNDALRSLKRGAARASFFRPDGIVPGSQRAERFFLWPMGIESAGAMRQWGTHATAFVGHRHFDDPFLFEAGLAAAGGGE